MCEGRVDVLVSYLELINEHGDRVQLILCALLLHNRSLSLQDRGVVRNGWPVVWPLHAAASYGLLLEARKVESRRGWIGGYEAAISTELRAVARQLTVAASVELLQRSGREQRRAMRRRGGRR